MYTQPEWANALGRDPTGANRTLLPIRVEDCKPGGMLAERIYVDLVGLDENDAEKTLFDALRKRGKPAIAPAFPGGEHAHLAPRPSHPTVTFPGTESMAESLWREKISYLHEQEVICSDPSLKYFVRKQIEEAQIRLDEIAASSVFALPLNTSLRVDGSRPTGDLSIPNSSKILDANKRKARLDAKGIDSSDVLEEILELKRKERVSKDLTKGSALFDGRFLLCERLGSGGFGTVWRARDNNSDRDVAIKILHPHKSSSENLERFFRGSRKMSQLVDGVVSVLIPQIQQDGHCYYVMEIVEGGNLREAVNRKEILPHFSVDIMIRLCTIMEQAQASHSEPGKFAHRDIKPANVLRTSNGELKLSDFDLVTAGDTTGGTLGGSAMGSFPYAAPELAANPDKADSRADIYSVAVTGIFVLNGKEIDPYAFLEDREDFISKLPTTKSIKECLTHATCSDPRRRFKTMASFRRALEGESAEIPRRQRRRKSRTNVVLKQATSSRLFGVKNRAAANRNERVAGVTLS